MRKYVWNTNVISEVSAFYKFKIDEVTKISRSVLPRLNVPIRQILMFNKPLKNNFYTKV